MAAPGTGVICRLLPPSRLIALVYLGAVCLAAGTVAFGVGPLRAAAAPRPGGPGATPRASGYPRRMDRSEWIIFIIAIFTIVAIAWRAAPRR
jgi:hypothetical protein